MIEIFIGLTAAAAGAGAGYFAAKKINDANYNVFLEQAKAKAKAIEFEAESILKDAKVKVSEAEFEAKKRYEEKGSKLQKEFNQKFDEIAKKEQVLLSEHEILKNSKEELEKSRNEAKTLYEEGLNLKTTYQDKLSEALRVLEHSAGLTEEEAREVVLKKVEEKSRADIAHIVRKYEEEAKREAKKRVNYILAQATSRYAGEFAAERLINVVNIKNDELKGRIIGKEGRNIKTLEMVLGVDVIIDDTPHAIVLSSFNLYRRAIATRVIELLVEDGRIQPARIEELHKKVCDEFEESILEEGENILIDLGISKVHPEIVKLIGKLKFRASYGQNALAHSLEVAHLAGIIAAETGGDEKLAKRAGILHDIGKALTHEYEGSHVDLGAEICKRYKEHPVVINAIYAHHGHEEALSVECAAVCAADALSAARPGARREVLESFLKRVEEIENIATSKEGIKGAYAINAGREIRVIANAKLVNDDEAVLLAKEIADEIQEKVQFPGEIKVNVIRELRAIEFAK
ncbi:ribonuclease Y [Campylobacter hyointestinalis]|uniref:Ribonuclease Y n=1 Tax=Campylobacter hyointestinalis subsp. hyointestinalis TaxID=91352 RepID=A0A9W5AWF6_CAMHY|nr:ribonuclease Y [Campylobacter hyointestinalis]PPB51314.1 ribonuclease Y [Campylobacter hyointestinalis subsp. hyointestinalis]PPB59817.1 ribonuclease Y [Campylobacter hyointestinalis subsp. hyointestinalis]PPB60715.1 ribonuclease Y [Campylobacter hyointestinalis subsp. hyointestinalis]PPB65436.1 ribonuclease Y [Campylobacter hyointestinalis subsp. hyointestinalis]PPB66418.1 ribonuclease Y [Campylobacter hyointestinalis subsp. hyointestinalis]